MKLSQLLIESDDGSIPPTVTPYIQIVMTGGSQGGRVRYGTEGSALHLKVADNLVDAVGRDLRLYEGLVSQMPHLSGCPWMLCRATQETPGVVAILVGRPSKVQVRSEGDGFHRLLVERNKGKSHGQLWILGSGCRLVFRLKKTQYVVVNDDGRLQLMSEPYEVSTAQHSLPVCTNTATAEGGIESHWITGGGYSADHAFILDESESRHPPDIVDLYLGGAVPA